MVRLVYDAAKEERSPADEAALAWVVRLTSGGTTPEDHEAFRQWRDLSPEHSEALARARNLWATLGSALPAAERQRQRRIDTQRLRKVAMAAPIAASLALVIGGGLEYWQVWRFDAVTQTGERRTMKLPDGSQVQLGADTAIKLAYSGGVRRVDLERGEALFQVRHDPDHPFVVHTGGVGIRDVGTVFDISHRGAVTKIVVASGSVEASSNDQRTLLSPGRGLEASAGRLGPVKVVNAEAETAWSRGRLVFDNQPLSEIVASLRPYLPGHIILIDAKSGRQRLSAAIDLNRIDDWLGALDKSKSVRLTRIGPVVLLK